jgi:hypothetical protein
MGRADVIVSSMIRCREILENTMSAQRPRRITLPRGWNEHVRSAVLPCSPPRHSTLFRASSRQFVRTASQHRHRCELNRWLWRRVRSIRSRLRSFHSCEGYLATGDMTRRFTSRLQPASHRTAGLLPIGLCSCLACLLPRSFKFIRDLTSRTEVHLVRRLSAKRRVWKLRVVLSDVERHQLLDCPDRVKRVQVKPLVFEDAPPPTS